MIGIGIIAIVICGIYYFQPHRYSWLGKEVTEKWMLPPELLGGKVIHIGDSYEEVVKKISLEAATEPPPIIGSAGVAEGWYFPVQNPENISFTEYYFNDDNILVSIGVNTKSFRLKEQDSIARYLIRRFALYYGDYTIYDWRGFARHKIIEWSRPDSGYIALSYYPYILNVKDNDSSRREEISVEVNYYPDVPRPSLSYPVSKNSRQELGLE